MRITNLFIFTISVVSIFSACSSDTEHLRDNKQVKEDLLFLASDSLEGRETGYVGAEKAAVFIADRFKQLGLTPAGADNSYFQTYDFVPHPPIQKHTTDEGGQMGMALVKQLSSSNVVGLMDKNAEETIIIGAHYDHVGWGALNSFHTGEPAIHNGADDNASGVSALLELADRLRDVELNHNILFIGFSGEEAGLHGSNFFCDNPTIDMDKVNCMLNMDMVGRLNESKTLAVNGSGTSPLWEDEVNASNADSLHLVFSESGVGPSDHTSFYLEDIPVLHFFTGQHEDYHRPSDDADKINFEGIMLVANIIEQLVINLNDNQNMEFLRTKDTNQENTPDFKVTLGVVPDYLFDGEGMRIDGVSEDRPAHAAGIIGGDIVIQMGEHAVTDMNTYMEGLSMWEKGDSTLVKVIRNGEPKSFMVGW